MAAATGDDFSPNTSRIGWMAEGLTAAYRRGGAERTPLFQLVVQHLGPERTVADIGAGVGRFTVPLARHGCRVWAVEPAEEMRERLRRHLEEAGLTAQVQVVAKGWPGAPVPPVEVALASYVLQLAEDPVAFVRALDRVATRQVILALHVDPMPMPEIMARLTGRPLNHRPPLFDQLWPRILEAGVPTPTVEMVEEDHRPPWEEPEGMRLWLARMGIAEGSPEAEAIFRQLGEEARRWPSSRRSALVRWSPERS
jgi:SAM-dependent methyltransferase